MLDQTAYLSLVLVDKTCDFANIYKCSKHFQDVSEQILFMPTFEKVRIEWLS